jgi:hypothetical protein
MVAAPSAHAAFPGSNGRIAVYEYTPGTDPPVAQIYTMNQAGGDTRQVTNSGSNLTPAWSPDSSKLAMIHTPGITATPENIYTVNADGTGLSPLTSGGSDSWPAWSPDGKKIAFFRGGANHGIYVINLDGTGETRLTGDPVGNFYPVWSPNGTKIAFQKGDVPNPRVYTMNADGTGQTLLADSATSPTWSPDGARVAFVGFPDGQIHAVNPDGTNQTQITHDSSGFQNPIWSPDGKAFAANRYDPTNDAWPIVVLSSDGTGVPGAIRYESAALRFDWGAIPINTYPRPRGATPFKTFLVPAYKACTAPDRMHGAPLSFGSCSAPQQTSSYLTVGTPDSNGLAASARGFMQYTTIVGNPSTPANEADVQIEVSIVGVLNKSDRSPYSGELSADAGLRITDKLNSPSPGGPGAATVQDSSFPVTVPCASSSCSVSTTANALVPGAVLEGKRAIWQLGQVKVYDGGSDGLASTTADNTLFMDQGVFVP